MVSHTVGVVLVVGLCCILASVVILVGMKITGGEETTIQECHVVYPSTNGTVTTTTVPWCQGNTTRP